MASYGLRRSAVWRTVCISSGFNIPFRGGNKPLTHLVMLLQVRKLANLIQMVSGEEADVAVHIGAQVVQIQRRRTAVRSVVVAAAPETKPV